MTTAGSVRQVQRLFHQSRLPRGAYAAPMSQSTPDEERPTTGGEKLKEDDQGAGIGLDDEPNTFELEEDPEATESD